MELNKMPYGKYRVSQNKVYNFENVLWPNK
jgi:hypothetical protein